MPTQQEPFTLSKFSLNRNTTQINLCMLLLILLAVLGIVLTNHSFNSVAESQRILLEANEERAKAPPADVNAPSTDVSASAAGAMDEAAQAISTGRTRLLIVGAVAIHHVHLDTHWDTLGGIGSLDTPHGRRRSGLQSRANGPR